MSGKEFISLAYVRATRSGVVNMGNMKALDNLCLSGDITENWKKWKQRWNLYAGGAAEKEKSVQYVILLHMIGEESLYIYNTFTFSQDEVHKIHPLIEKLDQYFAPKKNNTYQRYLLHTYIENERSFENFLKSKLLKIQ